MAHKSSEREIIIRPTKGWLELNLGDLWRYRDLLYLLVHREFASKYKQTVLGPSWFILQPLLMTLVFTVIFTGVAKISTDGLPPILFYLSGLLGWNYFSQTFQTTANTFITNANLFGKVYFPRLVVPLSAVLANLLAFALQLVTFLLIMGYYSFFTDKAETFRFDASVVFFPLLVVQFAAISLGAGLWLSALTAKYRDFVFVVPFMVQIWMYGTPIIYPLSRIPEAWQWLAALNPLTVPTEAMRLMFLGQGTVTVEHTLISLGITVFMLVTGALFFNRVERTFVDSV